MRKDIVSCRRCVCKVQEQIIEGGGEGRRGGEGGGTRGREGKERFSLGCTGEKPKIEPARKAEAWSQRASALDLILWIRRSHQRDLSRSQVYCHRVTVSLIVDSWVERGRSWQQEDQSFQRLLWPGRVRGGAGWEIWPSPGRWHPTGQSPGAGRPRHVSNKQLMLLQT